MSSGAARALVFFTSAAVLVLEIMAGRLLAPYVGVTLETFTGIIGTVLAGISLGAWIGGRAADLHDPRRLLGPVLAVGGILALLSPPLVDLVGPAARAAGPIEIVMLTAIAFFPPALVLSMVPPMVVKIRLRDLAETGAVVGRYSAVGTAGAIFGTFTTGFLLIATLPSRPIVLVLGIGLLIAGVLVWMGSGERRGMTAAVLAAVGAAAVLTIVDGPCDTETTYFCARVEADPARPSGRILFLDTLRHSYVDLEDPAYLGFRYSRIMDDVFDAVLPAGPVESLFIGGGGLTLPRYLAATRPGSTNHVLELDPGIVDIARSELGYVDDGSTTVGTGDARLGIRDVPAGAYDIVVGDAFGGPAVPWHLTTREFLEEVERTLRPDGLYIMNLIDYPPLGFARAEAATLAEVFRHVVVIAPDSYLAAEGGGNFVLAASDAALDVAAIASTIAARGGSETAVGGSAAADFIGKARVLTDEFAPVDQLISRP